VYRFAREPRWILSHVLVLALVVAMVFAAFWQLDRLQQRKDENALIRARTAEPVAPVTEVVTAEDPTSVGDDVRLRRVTAEGTYDVSEQVLVRNRTFDEAPGSWVLTPLVLEDGTALVVNRGWVSVTGDQALPADAAPPPGEVTVTGLLEATQARGRFGPTDPTDRELDTLSRVDLERYQQQVDADLLPVWLQLEEQDPPVATRPTPLPPPELSEGPHFSYAVQWGIFTTIAVVGYVLILRRRARNGPPQGERGARHRSLGRGPAHAHRGP